MNYNSLFSSSFLELSPNNFGEGSCNIVPRHFHTYSENDHVLIKHLYIPTGTADKDTECLHCTDGTFSNGTSKSCQSHTNYVSEYYTLFINTEYINGTFSIRPGQYKICVLVWLVIKSGLLLAVIVFCSLLFHLTRKMVLKIKHDLLFPFHPKCLSVISNTG